MFIKKSTIIALCMLPFLAVGINSCSQDPREKTVNILKDKGIESINYARELVYSCSRGDIETVHLLLMAGANVNGDRENPSPLCWAASNGHTEIVKMLLAVPGIDVNKTGDYGMNPLFEAARYGHTEIVKLLLATPGIDVNYCRIDGGGSPLYAAVKNGHIEIVKLLLSMPGVDVNRGGHIGYSPYSPLYMAVSRGDSKMVKLLLKAPGIDVNWGGELHAAVNAGNAKIVKLLLAAPGIDVNKPNEHGDTPLSKATARGHTKIVKMLKAAGAK